jgi:Ulp1 family protease
VEKTYNLRDSSHKLMKAEFILRNETLNKTETFPITHEDMDKLKPDTDLNDTIVGNYIKLVQFLLPA